MARRVYFAFHYGRDIWRANVVRNSWLTQRDRAADGRFIDASLWEETQRRGDEAVKRLIDEGLVGTSVTAVLIGAETAHRPWVRYEIRKSYERGNGLLGVHIYNIEDKQGLTDIQGPNPFDQLYVERDGRRIYLSSLYRTYYWYGDRGYENFPSWVEDAANAAGR